MASLRELLIGAATVALAACGGGDTAPAPEATGGGDSAEPATAEPVGGDGSAEPAAVEPPPPAADEPQGVDAGPSPETSEERCCNDSVVCGAVDCP